MSYLRPYNYYDSALWNAPRSSTWSEFIPQEHRYIDYEPKHRVDYVPVEKRALDYVEV